MNLSKLVVERLEQLAAAGPKQVEAGVLNSAQQQAEVLDISAEEQGLRVTLTLQDYDRYSAELSHLEVITATHNGRKALVDLHHCAELITRRLTYLEEPLAVVEFDANQSLAQLRSQPPNQDGEAVTYWEAMLWAEPNLRVKLSRYRWTPDLDQRELLTYPATFATLGRIANDLGISLLGQ